MASRPHLSPGIAVILALPYTALAGFVFPWTQLILVICFIKFSSWMFYLLGLLFHESPPLACPMGKHSCKGARLWAKYELGAESRRKSRQVKTQLHNGSMRLEGIWTELFRKKQDGTQKGEGGMNTWWLSQREWSTVCSVGSPREHRDSWGEVM